MNKLQKLLATKAEIEAELEKEKLAKIEAENKARRDKIVSETEKQQKMLDGMKYGQAKEYLDLFSSRFDVDLNTLWVFGAICYLLKVEKRELGFLLDSIKRYMENPE